MCIRDRDGLVKDARDYIERSSRFMEEDSGRQILAAGQRIRHHVFGPGVVTEVDLAKSAYVIQFDGMNTTRSISFRAKLEEC